MRRPDWRYALACASLLAACHADLPANNLAPSGPPAPGPTPAPSQILVLSGDGQQADPEDLLDDPVRFQVLDAKGNPLANVIVTFTTPLGGGSVPAPTARTDSTGVVQTAWTMGPQGGVQTLQAAVAGLVITAHAVTCQPDECYPPEVMSPDLSGATLLSLATYDSSGQTVHPDVVRGHGAVSGFWLAITPYPGGQSQYENPSIYFSRDAQTWTVPAGLVNPLVAPMPNEYNSDPDIVMNDDGRLWMYYRSVIAATNVISVKRSSDGVQWDPALPVITVPSHELVSPSVVRGAPQAAWQMWSVNAGPSGCSAPTTAIERRTSTDGVNWGNPVTVSLNQPGRVIWHIDVEWIAARSEFWALYNTYATGSTCTTDALFLARSPDGVNWTVYPSPIARAGVIGAFKDIVYRSTLITNPRATAVTLWISGAAFSSDSGYRWQTAKVSTSVTNLLGIAAAPSASLLSDPRRRLLPPPEPDVGH